MPGVSVGLVVGAREAKALAVGAHGTGAVASNLAVAAGRAGGRRLLGATVLGRRGGSDRGRPRRVEAGIRHGPHMAPGMKRAGRRYRRGNVHSLRRRVSWSSDSSTDHRALLWGSCEAPLWCRGPRMPACRGGVLAVDRAKARQRRVSEMHARIWSRLAAKGRGIGVTMR